MEQVRDLAEEFFQKPQEFKDKFAMSGVPGLYILERSFFCDKLHTQKKRTQTIKFTINTRQHDHKNSESGRGYQRVAENVTKGQRDWHEGFDFFRQLPTSHPLRKSTSSTKFVSTFYLR